MAEWGAVETAVCDLGFHCKGRPYHGRLQSEPKAPTLPAEILILLEPRKKRPTHERRRGQWAMRGVLDALGRRLKPNVNGDTPPESCVAKIDPCAELEPIDELLEWWEANRHDICQGNQRMFKKYDDLTKQIVDYRRKACDLMTAEYCAGQIVLNIDDLRRLSHPRAQDLEADQERFCKLWGDVQRELDRLEAGAGFATQALVTRWFHEAGFHIADMEVKHKDDKGCEHSFDIEIKDMGGNRYDVEVWQGTGQLMHEMQRATVRSLKSSDGRTLCDDPDKWEEIMKYMKGVYDVGDDAGANFRTLTKKMGQMREDRTGVVVACIRREWMPDLTLIPKEWGPRLPENRCVIALRIGDGGRTEERRGTGYLVCSPKFGHAGAAKSMIKSLKFEYVEYPTPLKYRWWEQ